MTKKNVVNLLVFFVCSMCSIDAYGNNPVAIPSAQPDEDMHGGTTTHTIFMVGSPVSPNKASLADQLRSPEWIVNGANSNCGVMPSAALNALDQSGGPLMPALAATGHMCASAAVPLQIQVAAIKCEATLAKGSLGDTEDDIAQVTEMMQNMFLDSAEDAEARMHVEDVLFSPNKERRRRSRGAVLQEGASSRRRSLHAKVNSSNGGMVVQLPPKVVSMDSISSFCESSPDVGRSNRGSMSEQVMMEMLQQAGIQKHDTPMDTKLILSIDGGGSRGIIPLFYLSRLQEKIGIPLKFDMIAGTSVGAMVGAAVALGKIEELHQQFPDFVDRIFKARWGTFGGMSKPTYGDSGRLECLQEIVGDMTGADLKTDFLATFYSLLTREAKVYTNFDNDEDFRLADVLMMTSAAPTYFDPHCCQSVHGDVYEGIDGGVFANHPGMIAYMHAKNKYPNSKLVMISLGTGRHNSCCDSHQSDGRGLLYWARTFSDLAIDSTSFNCNALLHELSEHDENFEYIRIQPALEKSYMIVDGADPEHLRKLETVALTSIGSCGSERDRFERAEEVLMMLLRDISSNDNAEQHPIAGLSSVLD